MAGMIFFGEAMSAGGWLWCDLPAARALREPWVVRLRRWMGGA
jgi:hypothetical protein